MNIEQFVELNQVIHIDDPIIKIEFRKSAQ
jgi:hypothetical protein